MSIASRIARAAGRDIPSSYTVTYPGCTSNPRAKAVPQLSPRDQPALRCAIAGRTHRGQVRRINQDMIEMCSIGRPAGDPVYLGLVADGVGGAHAGERASALAAATSRNRIELGVSIGRANNDLSCEQLLCEAVRAANRHVYQTSCAGQLNMGTTLTVALIAGDRAHIASVGDSRAYLLRAGGSTGRALIAQLTADHSVAARLVEAGSITHEQARSHPQRSLLYRTVGAGPTVDVDVVSLRVKTGDRILLCSDGISEYVSDEELAQITLAQPDPASSCERLLALANERGGADNISVVIVRIEALMVVPPPRPTPSAPRSALP